MPVNSTPIPSKLNSEKIPLNTLSYNPANKGNCFLSHTLSIENNIINVEKNNYLRSSLTSINDFFSQIKNKLLNQSLTPAATDIVLDKILSQGRQLSHDSEAINSLLNNRSEIIPSSSPSLTTKAGVALGGVLLTSAIVGSGYYYFKRTGREHHQDITLDTTHRNLSSTSLIPYTTQDPFHAHHLAYLHHESPEIQSDVLFNRKQINRSAKKTARFNISSLKSKNMVKVKSLKHAHRPSSCLPINSKRKIKIPGRSYTYTTRQTPICLTESFNQRCQVAHRQARAKRGCLNIMLNMVLKITGKYCWCPPPDWLEMKIIEPERFIPSTIMQTTTQPTPRTSIVVKSPPGVITTDNNEMVKHKISDSYGYFIPQKSSLDIINTTLSDDEENHEVKKVSLIECYNERENITLAKSLRIISETIKSPVATTLREGLVVIKYNFLGQGCVNNSDFYETSKKVEETITYLLSWLPGVNRLLFITGVAGSLLETFADALDDNELKVDDILDLNLQFINLSKDVISSIKTKDINDIAKKTNQEKIKEIIKPLEYKKNELVINNHDGNVIKTKKNLNHLFNEDRNGFIFYDNNKKWMIDNNIKSNNHIRETFEKSRERWEDTDNIYFFKNSSPDIYGDAILLRYHGKTYTLTEGSLYKTNEIQLTDDVFRYLIKDDDKFLPIIYKGESWFFEESSSPSISNELNYFLINNNKIKNRLVSDHINHQDISPLTPGREVQFDKDFNKYIKINNQYYKLKQSIDTSHYIEGEHDMLSLQLIDNKYHIKKSLFDGICCFHREPIDTIPELNQVDTFYLDNTVISKINSMDFLSNSQHTMISSEATEYYFTKSQHIDGAIINNKIDYIYYKNKFIKIHSNGDNTYILGDINDREGNIKIYKSPGSDTYFTIPKKIKKWKGLIAKTRRCIVKKHPSSVCNTEYFETERISYLLNPNNNHGITINEYQNSLDNNHFFPNIYNKKGSEKELYYKSEGNYFFHARLNIHKPISFTPTTFIIYGKDINQQIDYKTIITSISVIRDFDTNKIIFSTPGEAQENIFDIDKKYSDLFLKWQEEDKVYRDITPADLPEIVKNIPLLNDLSDLDDLFNRKGKKIITSIDYSEKALKDRLDRIILSINDLEMNNLNTFQENKKYPVIEDICNQAFKKTIRYIKDATTTIESSKDKLDNYILNVLKISDVKARENFINSLKNKLQRMHFIFDENNKENIIILARKHPENENILSEEGKNMLGFTILHDPLDRIFINTAVIADIYGHTISQKNNKGLLEGQGIPQPDTPKRNRVYFTNLISETMLHEAVHALGSPEDYLYLYIDTEGHIDNISDSISHIEEAITEGAMDRIKFEFLTKIYFMSNPLYKDFSIRSLNKPEILKDIFRDDSFFRAIILLNNPDTISLLIRELAGTKLQDEE